MSKDKNAEEFFRSDNRAARMTPPGINKFFYL